MEINNLVSLKTRDVFFQSERIKGITHLGTYNMYVQKEDALIIQTLTTKQLTDIANRHRQHELKKTKGGKPSYVARNFIISLPPLMEREIDRHNEKQMREMVSFITSGFLDSVKKSNPNANINWLKKNMTVSLHRDTEHTHFHIVAPTLVPTDSLLNNKFILVDYATRAISYKTRRTIYNWCKKHLLSQEVSEEHFIELAKNEKANGKKLASWKQRKEALVQSLAKTEQARKRVNKIASQAIKVAQKLADDNEKWIKKVSNAIDRLAKKVEDLSIDYTTADKELNRINTMIVKTQDADIKTFLQNELTKLKNSKNIDKMRK